MSSGAHLGEWQRRSFDISSGARTPEQTADSYRANLLSIQYAWADSQLSRAGAAALLRTCSERYAAVVDSDNPRAGLNNYAEGALHLARTQKNHSDKWESALTTASVRELPCVRKMIRAGTVGGGGGGGSLVAPADVDVCVGREGGGGFLCPLPGVDAEPPPSKSTGFPKAEGSGAFMNPPGGAAGGFERIPGDPRASARPPARAQSLFGGHNSSPNRPAANPGGQSACFSSSSSSSSNPSKRKSFYVSSSAEGGCPDAGRRWGAAAAAGGGGGQAGPDSRSSGSFKTAREQLVVEQQKKHSHHRQQQRAPPPGAAAAAKKSLGANRPRGTFSKFVSPVPRQGEEEGVAGGHGDDAPQENPIVDERLKNFEPKIIELIMSEIMDHGPPVAWDDIAGLEFAKATIKEIVVWPMLRPDIFTGLRGPPKGILLFGPPGTGKTLIGKCIACQSGATFFSISASSLTSKWVGEGEKMVRALFAIARCHQPAVIFIDEIDSLLSQRTDGEHDSSRRIKTEFLVQLDGAATSADDRILVVGATNRPQEIDEAARRRLSKRLYIPLPEAAARRQIVVGLMAREKSRLAEEELRSVVEGSEGFSGADMTQLCREAALGPIRSIRFCDMATVTAEQVRPILYADFQEALKTVRPSVSAKDLELFQDWNKTFGCGR